MPPGPWSWCRRGRSQARAGELGPRCGSSCVPGSNKGPPRLSAWFQPWAARAWGLSCRPSCHLRHGPHDLRTLPGPTHLQPPCSQCPWLQRAAHLPVGLTRLPALLSGVARAPRSGLKHTPDLAVCLGVLRAGGKGVVFPRQRLQCGASTVMLLSATECQSSLFFWFSSFSLFFF